MPAIPGVRRLGEYARLSSGRRLQEISRINRKSSGTADRNNTPRLRRVKKGWARKTAGSISTQSIRSTSGNRETADAVMPPPNPTIKTRSDRVKHRSQIAKQQLRGSIQIAGVNFPLVFQRHVIVRPCDRDSGVHSIFKKYDVFGVGNLLNGQPLVVKIP